MRLPRLTTRRLVDLLAVEFASALALVLLGLSWPGDAGLATLAVALIGLLGLATTLPFAAYRLLPGRAFPRRLGVTRRPPRLPRGTARRLSWLVAVLAIAFGSAILSRHLRVPSRSRRPAPSGPIRRLGPGTRPEAIAVRIAHVEDEPSPRVTGRGSAGGLGCAR